MTQKWPASCWAATKANTMSASVMCVCMYVWLPWQWNTLTNMHSYRCTLIHTHVYTNGKSESLMESSFTSFNIFSGHALLRWIRCSCMRSSSCWVGERESVRAVRTRYFRICVLFVSVLFLATWMQISYSTGRARTHSNVCSDNKHIPCCFPFCVFRLAVAVAVSVTRDVITTSCYCCWLSNVFQSQWRVCENENENEHVNENMTRNKSGSKSEASTVDPTPNPISNVPLFICRLLKAPWCLCVRVSPPTTVRVLVWVFCAFLSSKWMWLWRCLLSAVCCFSRHHLEQLSTRAHEQKVNGAGTAHTEQSIIIIKRRVAADKRAAHALQICCSPIRKFH